MNARNCNILFWSLPPDKSGALSLQGGALNHLPGHSIETQFKSIEYLGLVSEKVALAYGVVAGENYSIALFGDGECIASSLLESPLTGVHQEYTLGKIPPEGKIATVGYNYVAFWSFIPEKGKEK